MKRILLFLIGMLAAVNMQAEVVEGYGYQGMTFSYDTDTHNATLTDGKSIVSSKVVIPGSFVEGGITYTVTSIGANAFKGNTNDINHVIIPEEVTTIGESAFDGCNQIKLIELPSNLSSIGAIIFEINFINISLFSFILEFLNKLSSILKLPFLISVQDLPDSGKLIFPIISNILRPKEKISVLVSKIPLELKLNNSLEI